MRFPSQIMRQTVHVRAAGEDLGDGATLGPSLPLRCRLDVATGLTRTASGDDVAVAATLLCRADQRPGHADPATLKPGDQVTAAGDDRTIYSVAPAYTPSGRVAGYQVVLR